MTEENSGRTWKSGIGEVTDETGTRTEPTDLTLDQLFDVLANQRRRYVLSYLHETETTVVEFSDLIAAVVARESDRDRDTDHYETVAIDIRHTHLPKLAHFELLEYDDETQTIQYHGHPLLEEHLALANEYDSKNDVTERPE